VVSVDLPQSVAANSVVDSGAPARLVVGDANHVGLLAEKMLE
jgi:hypothetical protein